MPRRLATLFEKMRLIALLNMPVGSIIVWAIARPIPIGWVLCDGNNGTPDIFKEAPKNCTYIMKELAKEILP